MLSQRTFQCILQLQTNSVFFQATIFMAAKLQVLVQQKDR